MRFSSHRRTILLSRARRCRLFAVACIAMALSASAANRSAKTADAKTPAATSQPDVLIFTNGDKLTGTLERVTAGTVFFETDGAGKLQVPWGKIQELRTDQPFAILTIAAKARHNHRNRMVPVGSFRMTHQQVTIHTSTGDQTIPVAQITFIVDAATYNKAVEKIPGPLQGWTGSITGGASTVTSTQNVTTYNSAITLTRSTPAVAWLPAGSRTQLVFTSTYGHISQPNTPTIKTNIFHADAEQDKYFSARFYMLAQSVFDHNSALGLDLQQTYGGGFGYSAIKNPKQSLDVTVAIDSTQQQFQTAGSSQNLIGSTFANNYKYNLPRGLVLTEISSILPEWNNMDDYSANTDVGLALPVLKKLAFSVEVIDSYLNDPPTGFQANSLQINTGLTYTLP